MTARPTPGVTTNWGAPLNAWLDERFGLHRFYVEDYGAVGDDTTDDTSAINSAIQAAFAYANSSGTYYAEVVFQPRTYKIAGAYLTTYYGNAQIPIPYQPVHSNKVTLVLRGAFDAAAWPLWYQESPQRTGAVLRSTGAGGTPDATNGDYAVIGGPSWQRGFGVSGSSALVGPDAGTTNAWNNVKVVIDGISVVVPSPANQMGIQLQSVAQAAIGAVSVFSNAAPAGAGSYVQSTNSRAVGLAMPNDYNNADNTIRNYSCEGMYTGLILGEHTVADAVRMLYCHTAIYVANRAHFSVVTYAVIEICTVGIYMDGRADILMADFEDNSVSGGVFATTFYVQATSGASGTVRYFSLDGNSTLINTSFVDLQDGTAVRVLDARQMPGYRDTSPTVPASTSYLLNPYYRDAHVTISGGTVSKVEVWSPSTAATYKTLATTTNVTVFVPSGSYIKLTYTAAPTWTWCLTSATL